MCHVLAMIRELRFDDGNVNDNATNKWFDWLNKETELKLNFALSQAFCDYSMLITLYKIDELQFRLLGTNGFHVNAKTERFTAASSHCRQNLKYENFTSSFGRLRQNIAPKSMLHVQHDYFSSFNQSNYWFVALSLTLPSSNLKLPNKMLDPFWASRSVVNWLSANYLRKFSKSRATMTSSSSIWNCSDTCGCTIKVRHQ